MIYLYKISAYALARCCSATRSRHSNIDVTVEMLLSPDVYILLLGPVLSLLSSIKGLLINEGQRT
jgi:hypothetical protein